MTFVSAVLSNSFKSRIASLFSMNLSRLFHCSVIKVLCLLPFSNFYILSDVQVLVNNFFIFLCRLSNATTLISYHVCHCLSTTFFILFRKYRAEKEGFEPSRRSTRPIPLAGAPLRPLEYFSRYFLYKITSLRDALFILLKTVLFVNLFFNFYSISDANFLIDVSYRLFPS